MKKLKMNKNFVKWVNEIVQWKKKGDIKKYKKKLLLFFSRFANSTNYETTIE